jgi:hypothetical protein
MHYLGEMQSLWLLEQVVYIVMTGLQRVKMHLKKTGCEIQTCMAGSKLHTMASFGISNIEHVTSITVLYRTKRQNFEISPSLPQTAFGPSTKVIFMYVSFIPQKLDFLSFQLK